MYRIFRKLKKSVGCSFSPIRIFILFSEPEKLVLIEYTIDMIYHRKIIACLISVVISAALCGRSCVSQRNDGSAAHFIFSCQFYYITPEISSFACPQSLFENIGFLASIGKSPHKLLFFITKSCGL